MHENRSGGVSGRAPNRPRIHTFEKKLRRRQSARQKRAQKSHTRKFTKFASARSPAAGGLYADPWVGTNRSDRSKPPQRRHSVGRDAAPRSSPRVDPKLCIPGRLNQNCGHGASIRIGMAMAHARQRARYRGGARWFDRDRAEREFGSATRTRRPRREPAVDDAAAVRALLFAPAVPHRSVGPHAWSARSGRPSRRRARSQSRRERAARLSHCTARRRRPFSPQKLRYVGVRGTAWPYAGFRPYKF